MRIGYIIYNRIIKYIIIQTVTDILADVLILVYQQRSAYLNNRNYIANTNKI